jgi:cytochrome c oxidase subunit IV
VPTQHRQITVAQRLLAFACLLALATLSLGIGTHLRLAWWDVVISLAIAAAKTLLVLWFFMDLAEQPFRARLAISVAVVLVVLLVGFSTLDVATRLVMPRAPAPGPTEAFFAR